MPLTALFLLLLLGIIGGLLAYIIIHSANWIIDKVSEFGHWTMTGTDTDVPVIVDRSFIGRVASNTGTAGLVRSPAEIVSFL